MNHKRPSRPSRRKMATFIALTVAMCVAFLPFDRAVSAQNTAALSVGDYVVAEGDELFEITIVLSPGDNEVNGVEFTLEFDQTLVAPILAEVGPTCEIVIAGGTGACGPANPTSAVNVAVFTFPGGWTDEADLVTLSFERLDRSGSTSLDFTNTTLVDRNGISIATTTTSGVVNLPAPEPTPTPQPTVTPTPTPTPQPTATPQPVTGTRNTIDALHRALDNVDGLRWFENRKVRSARNQLSVATRASLWSDEDTLIDDRGRIAMNRLRRAVVSLSWVRDAEVRSIRNDLVDQMAVLAQTQIDQLLQANGDRDLLARANRQFQRGELRAEQRWLAIATVHFRNAWVLADRADQD